MIAIVRVKTGRGSDVLWNYILENQEELEKEFEGKAKLVYITKRAKHEDTSLFIKAEDPDVLGDFVAKRIAKIKGVDAIWMFSPTNMKFFYIKESLLREQTRFTVTIKAYPREFENIYNTISNFPETSDVIPVYLAYTFHLFTDSILFSFVAEDVETAQKFVASSIGVLPGVLGTSISKIKRQQCLSSKEEWKAHVRAHLRGKNPDDPIRCPSY